jgi:hypothetical protein
MLLGIFCLLLLSSYIRLLIFNNTDFCCFIKCLAFDINALTMSYIIENQLTHYFTVFVVLARMESQGNYAIVIKDLYLRCIEISS